MRNIFLIALNILKVTFKRKANWLIFILLPVIVIVLTFVLGNMSSPKNMNIGFINKDKGSLGNEMINKLKAQGNVNLKELDQNTINSQITGNKIECAFIIPSSFSEDIYKNALKNIDVISLKNQESSIWLKSYLDIYISNLLDISSATGGEKNKFEEVYSNIYRNSTSVEANTVNDVKGSKSTAVRSMGWFILAMMFGTTTAASFILVEKKNRTYFRICSSPVSSKHYLAGNLIANLAIVFIQISLILAIAVLIFKVNFYLPVWQLMLILITFSFAAIGLGFLLVSFSKDSVQSNTFANLIVTPTCMISGCFWPLESMPKFMQNASNFIPQKWALEAIQKVQEGSGLSSIIMHLSIILAFALTFFLISAYKFSRSSSVKTVI